MLAPDRWLKRGWRAFVLNAGAFAGATFILVLAAGFPAGLLCFPLGMGPGGLSAGLLLVPLGLGLLEMALRARRGEAVAAREVIRGFRFFGPGLLLWLVVVAASLTVSACGHVPVVGALTGVIAGPLLNLFGVLAALCIVDRGSGVREALGRVLLVAERNWVGLWAVSLLFMFLESLGGFFFGIGILVTVPWIACSWAAAYQDLFDRA